MVITDYENGILVPCGDAQKIADAISAFADDEALAAKCGMNARNVMERFSPAEIGNQWENYVKKIISMGK